VFFLNADCDTPANNGCLERLSWCTSLDEFSPMLPYHYHIYNKFLDKSAFCSGKISGHPGERRTFYPNACVTSCNRVFKCFCFNTMFQIEINIEWEKFFILLRKRFRTFMKKSSAILFSRNSWLFRIALDYQIITGIRSIWHQYCFCNAWSCLLIPLTELNLP